MQRGPQVAAGRRELIQVPSSVPRIGLAGDNGAAGLTAIYYSLAYLGFAAPYLIVLGTHLASYTVLLAVAALLALGTAALITRAAASEQTADEQTAACASRSQAAG